MASCNGHLNVLARGQEQVHRAWDIPLLFVPRVLDRTLSDLPHCIAFRSAHLIAKILQTPLPSVGPYYPCLYCTSGLYHTSRLVVLQSIGYGQKMTTPTCREFVRNIVHLSIDTTIACLLHFRILTYGQSLADMQLDDSIASVACQNMSGTRAEHVPYPEILWMWFCS